MKYLQSTRNGDTVGRWSENQTHDCGTMEPRTTQPQTRNDASYTLSQAFRAMHKAAQYLSDALTLAAGAITDGKRHTTRRKAPPP